MSNTEEEVYYSTTHVAQTFELTTETIRNWIDRGYIKGIKVGLNYRIPKSEVIRIAKERYGDG